MDENNYKHILAFDLETIADRSVIPFLPELKSKSAGKIQGLTEEINILNAEINSPEFENIPKRSQTSKIQKIPKLEMDIKSIIAGDASVMEAAHKKRIKEMGMTPSMNMICCASFSNGDQVKSFLLEEESREAERDLLLKCWEYMRDFEVFTGFNSRTFDLRAMLLHGAREGITPSVNIDKGRYNRGNHIDLRQVFTGSDQFASGKLEYFLNYFRGTGKTEGMDGELVQDFWDVGLKDDIRIYCENDADETHGLYVVADIGGLLE